jgi:hypothetical protein
MHSLDQTCMTCHLHGSNVWFGNIRDIGACFNFSYHECWLSIMTVFKHQFDQKNHESLHFLQASLFKIKAKTHYTLRKYARLVFELKYRLQVAFDPRKNSSTNQSTRIRLTWIKGPTFGHNRLRQELWHVD